MYSVLVRSDTNAASAAEVVAPRLVEGQAQLARSIAPIKTKAWENAPGTWKTLPIGESHLLYTMVGRRRRGFTPAAGTPAAGSCAPDQQQLYADTSKKPFLTCDYVAFWFRPLQTVLRGKSLPLDFTHRQAPPSCRWSSPRSGSSRRCPSCRPAGRRWHR